MQALFYMDVAGGCWESQLTLFNACFCNQKQVPPFFLELVRGVAGSREEIDHIIEKYSSHWKISRMSCVDRNIMRIAVYELFFQNDIPAKVTINEAIDIGKKYGTEESGAFINGILDSIRQAVDTGAIEPPVRRMDQARDGEVGTQTFQGAAEKRVADHEDEGLTAPRSVPLSPGVRKRFADRNKRSDQEEESR